MTRGIDVTDGDPLAPARRLTEFMGEVIAAASVLAPSVWNDSALRCRRRPQRRPCPGRLRVRAESTGQIDWACPVCNDQGTISSWQGSLYDLSSHRGGSDGPRLKRYRPFVINEGQIISDGGSGKVEGVPCADRVLDSVNRKLRGRSVTCWVCCTRLYEPNKQVSKVESCRSQRGRAFSTANTRSSGC